MSEQQWQHGQYVTTDRQAEQMAAAAMRAMGYRDARETPVGPDGGIDVRATDAVAQVKFRGAQTGRSDLQRLVGARGRDHHLALFFFTATGYSARAREYAAEMDVALFVFDPMGSLTAYSPSAQRFLTSGTRPATTTATPPKPSAFKLWWRKYWLEAITVFCWISVPVLIVGKLGGDEDLTWAEPTAALVIGAIGTLAWRYRNGHALGPNFKPRTEDATESETADTPPAQA